MQTRFKMKSRIKWVLISSGDIGVGIFIVWIEEPVKITFNYRNNKWILISYNYWRNVLFFRKVKYT